jgi:hypothetical protein
MTEYNPAIAKLNMPRRFRKLPVDERGYPVPKFVAYVNGKPDFRALDYKFFGQAFTQNLCWLCGERLGQHVAFVLGPMCAVNRINSEPPSHLDCARFAVKACPFLTQPRRRRNDQDLPWNAAPPGGIMIERNPGVSLVWVCETYKALRLDDDSILFRVGEPSMLEWYCHGRKATRAEIMESIETGIPILRGMAEKEGRKAVEDLERQYERAMVLVPAE